MPTVSELLAREFPGEYRRMDIWRARLEDAESQAHLFMRIRPAVTSPPEGRAVMAVALTAWPQEAYDRPVPAVALQSNAPSLLVVTPSGERYSSRPAPIEAFDELEQLQTEVGRVLELDGERVPVIGLPRLLEQVAPGDRAFCGAGPASFGSRVLTSAGVRALLTAGHAAPTTNTSAYDVSSSLVGQVAASVRCASVQPGVATPDVAVVELLSHVPDSSSNAPTPTGTGHALLWDTITAYGAQTSGQGSAVVMTGAPFAGPTMSGGNFGEATLTAYAISAPGDSGAPVHNQRGELVGHVVAGNPGVSSLVQDVTYQLSAFNATLR